MLKKRMSIGVVALSCIVCIAFLALYNDTFWQKSHVFAPVKYTIPLGLLAGSIMFLVLTVFSFQYVFKPFLIMAFFVAALSSYAMDNYGYVISTEAFRNIIETNSNELFDLIHVRFLLKIAIFFILPTILILYVRIRYVTLKTQLKYILLCCLLCILNLSLCGKYYATMFRNHKTIKYYINPIRPFYAMMKYTVLKFKPHENIEFILLDPNPVKVASNKKPKLVVLVLGESDRALNHRLNGYAKDTNPYLSKRKDLVSFSNFHSCGTETTVSLPCMFSVYKREEYNEHKGLYTENVLDLLQKSNINVLWRDNDGGCKNVCDRVETHDLNEVKIQPYCNDFECHDEVLLHNLQDYITASNTDKLFVLHKKGNHGPAYYKRYPEPFAKFSPTCNTNELHNCSNEEIVNTYDNIVLYTDYFLDKVISQLEANNDKYQVALIYVSDHGESLGEKGIYLHAMPYWLAPKEQTHVPFMFWASSDFEMDAALINHAKHKELSHDHLFHTLLGLFNVQTTSYVKELDIFATT